MGNSKIEWTQKNYNTVMGCSHASAGCQHCYAERMALRFNRSFGPWTAQNAESNVKLIEKKIEEPLSWKTGYVIFVNSAADTFHPLVPDAYIDRMWEVMKQTPHHRYLVLTKRPDRMAEYVKQRGERPPHNIWLGTSVEQQKWVSRIQSLAETGYTHTFISVEPLLERVALGMYINAVKWVIVGGESGPHCRPMEESWVRSLKGECEAAGVPFFFKQWGGYPDKRGHEMAILDGQLWHGMPRDLERLMKKSEPIDAKQLGLFDD